MTDITPKRILLAEDDNAMRSFLSLMLSKSEYDVVACEDGREAFNALTENTGAPFDLLLTDVVMPHMDGVELTQKALSFCPSLKVLYITGFAAVESTNPAENRSQIIPKPFHMNELLEKISETLNKAS